MGPTVILSIIRISYGYHTFYAKITKENKETNVRLHKTLVQQSSNDRLKSKLERMKQIKGSVKTTFLQIVHERVTDF